MLGHHRVQDNDVLFTNYLPSKELAPPTCRKENQPDCPTVQGEFSFRGYVTRRSQISPTVIPIDGDSCLKSAWIWANLFVLKNKNRKLTKWVLCDSCLLHFLDLHCFTTKKITKRLLGLLNNVVSACFSVAKLHAMFPRPVMEIAHMGFVWWFSHNNRSMDGSKTHTKWCFFYLRVPNISKQLCEPGWYGFSFNLSYTPVTRHFADPTFYVWCSERNGQKHQVNERWVNDTNKGDHALQEAKRP